jgi:acyl-CoA thioesterase I
MKKMVCMGDSLTEAADLEDGFAWPAILGNLFSVDALNYGIGGDTTGGMLARLYVEVREIRPDMVMILGGTNDLWWGLDRQLVLANTFSMVRQAQHLGAIALIATPPPVCIAKAGVAEFEPPENGYEHLQAELARLAEVLQREAGGYDVPCVNIHGLFFTAEGRVNGDLFLEDGLHLNQEGHRRMAALTDKIMRESFLFDDGIVEV